MKYFIFLFLIFTSSCSLISYEQFNRVSAEKIYEGYEEVAPADYLDQLSSLSKDYLATSDVKQIKVSKKSYRYLHELYNKIVSNNELLLDKDFDPEFYIIKEEAPLIFSLPYGKFFISSSLITQYMKHEGILSAALSYEIIKTHLGLYPKNTITPVGFLSTERIVSLTRVPLDVRLEIDKWAFYVLDRSGIDSYTFMLWVQIQNKNSLDFSLQYGDSRGISREEFQLKNFLVKSNLFEMFTEEEKYNSTYKFYYFRNEVKRLAER